MKTYAKINIFSETALTILVSVVTLLLQIISFATTWSGSRIYLEGVFPYASLLFAVAIQATAYFFSNSLRNKISVLKVVAMVTALCCSTYYSYIGIYNSVNSPVKFLQERYVRIQEELTGIYDTVLEENLGMVREALGDAASAITSGYTMLLEEKGNMEACREALGQENQSYAESMRAPRESAFETYEGYVEAYKAYVAGISSGSNTESEALQEGILISYGFSSIENLQKAEAENAAAISALRGALGIVGEQTADEFFEKVSDTSVKLTSALNNAMLGEGFDNIENASLNRLFQAAKLCGYEKMSVAEMSNIVKSASDTTAHPLMREYTALVGALEGGEVTAANTMELKGVMDAEILTALLKMNSLLPSEEQLSYEDQRYQITDLYLVPIRALQSEATGMTAFFCFGVAALTDILSVLFAVSLRGRKPLWKRGNLVFAGLEDYVPQIYASLPPVERPAGALAEFLSHFVPSPETEYDGYMMCTDVKEVSAYYPLVALLCQTNLAKLVPGSFLEEGAEEQELLLLKARFVFWANSVIYEENAVVKMRNRMEKGVSA